MDVRCENCGTEYELDDERLKPGGVTVQCATCEHTFKVGRRMSTALGVGSRSRPPSPAGERFSWDDDDRTGARSGPEAIPAMSGDTPGDAPGELAHDSAPVGDGTPIGPMDISPSGSRGKGRNWLIRLPSGQIETCRELATLQQWIVAGKVTRHSGISRTGKTWKRLGELRDLASFFQIADEARGAAPQSYPGEPVARPDPAATLLGVPVAPHASPGSAPLMLGVSPSAPVSRAGSDAARHAGGDQVEAPAGEADAAPRPRHVFAHAASGAESAWRGSLRGAKADSDDGGPRGPTGGLGRRAPAQAAAFTGTPIRPRDDRDDRDEKNRPAEALLPEDDELPAESRGGGAGRWIVLLSLLLMAGAATVVYQFVFRDGAFLPVTETPAALVDAAVPDAEVVIPDAGPALDSEQQAILAAVDERIAANTRAGIEALAHELDEIAATTAGADELLDLLVARTRVQTALAQHGFDEAAALADAGDEEPSRRVRRDAEERVLAALALAQKARRLDREHAGALVVMADILRLQGRSAAQIDGYLEQALAQDPSHYEARLVRALALAAGDRDDSKQQARALLAELAARRGDDVRPLYRLALLDLQARRFDEAEEHTAQVIAVQPTHEGALALPARIREAMAVDTSDPMPPEEGDEAAGSDGDDTGDGDDRRDRGASGNTYDALLARAIRKRQAGGCTEALDLFERAIELNPIGVEALTGMGYCHVERREFASAHGKFRAALGVSSRNQDAIWGIAESYAAQGLKAQAVEWYERYLDEHPNGSRAAAARRQIERIEPPATDRPAPEGGGEMPPPDPENPADPADPDNE